MKTGIIFLFVCMRLCVRGLPVNDKEVLSSSCIEITPERVHEIRKIVDEVNGLIETLSDKHEDLDLTLVKLNIEKHSDDEHDEKETVLKIVINNCKNANTKTRKSNYLEDDLVADDYSTLSSEENTGYSDTKSDVDNFTSDFDTNYESLKDSVINLKVKEKRSKINENAKSVKETKQTQSKSKEEPGEESSTGKNDNGNELRDKTTRQLLQDDEIENLIKELEDLNDKQLLSDSDNGVYFFASTIDNSKVELNNNYDELFKNLYNSAIQKLTSLETELEKMKNTQTDNGLPNFKELFNKFDRNVINPYYGFGGNLFDNYVNGVRSNSVYGNTGLEVIYF